MLLRFAVNELWENECGSTEFSYTDEMFSLLLGLLIVCSRVRNYYCFISFEGIHCVHAFICQVLIYYRLLLSACH